MSSLRNILNPPEERRRIVRLLINPDQSTSLFEIPSSPASSFSGNTLENPGDDPEPSGGRDHAPHPDCPDALACLPDTDGRPQHTLPVILRCAILGSPRKRLTIREIYAAMEEKYSYYKTAGPTWKQSVRHHLSLNRLFERQPRPATDPGFGSYWTVNLSAPPGTKRPRKRGRPNKDKETEGLPPKRRGRPRKDGTLGLAVESAKAPVPPSEDEDTLTAEEYVDAGHMSEEEEDFESEDEMTHMHPFERRKSAVGLSAYTSTSAIPIPPSAHQVYVDGYDSMVERLQMEMAEIRRQSADAVSLSIRLSDQLSQAQAESSRARAALRSSEAMLEDESKKRREAEKIADEEARLRRAAEDALKLTRYRMSVSPRER